MFALLAIAEAPAELSEGYTRIIRAVAPKSARAALEELMMTHLMLLRIMAARGLEIPEHIRVRVAECADTDRLEAWADRAATATSLDDIFEA
jgi:hypothetical protein